LRISEMGGHGRAVGLNIEAPMGQLTIESMGNLRTY
jgi:hypothetical protein